MVTLSLGKHLLDFGNSLNELKNQLSSSCKVELQIGGLRARTIP